MGARVTLELVDNKKIDNKIDNKKIDKKMRMLGMSGLVIWTQLSGFLFPPPTTLPLPDFIRGGILTAMVLIVAVYDGRFRRIPNWIVFPIMLIGGGSHLVWPGELGRWAGGSGVLTGFLLLLFPYLAGGMKAGDVKLLMAIGALTGGRGAFAILLVTLLLCYPTLALLAVVRARKIRVTWLRFRRVLFHFLGLFLPAMKLYAIRLESLDDPTIPSVTTPFGVALAAGTLLTQYASILR
jgi:prepilin peptidase CpaA